MVLSFRFSLVLSGRGALYSYQEAILARRLATTFSGLMRGIRVRIAAAVRVFLIFYRRLFLTFFTGVFFSDVLGSHFDSSFVALSALSKLARVAVRPAAGASARVAGMATNGAVLGMHGSIRGVAAGEVVT